MKYIQLASCPDDHQHYTVCVPVVARPAAASCSIIDLGTPADKKRKIVALTDEEYASLPESELSKVESDLFAPVDIFDPQAILDGSTAEELKDLLIVSVVDGNVVWEYTDSNNNTYPAAIAYVEEGTNVAFTLATTLNSAIGSLPLKWSATTGVGATISIDNSTGVVAVTHPGTDPVHGTLTVTIDMNDFYDDSIAADYPGRHIRASKTFDLNFALKKAE